MILLALALQTAAAPAAEAPTAPAPVETRADGSQRWSIMSCATRSAAGEVVVCGRKDQNQFEGPPVGRGANRDLSAANALALAAPPCAARLGGCQVGVNVLGPPTMLVRVVQKLINPKSDCCEGDDATNPLSLVRDAARAMKKGKPVDTTGRVPIALDAPGPAGRIEPAVSPTPVAVTGQEPPAKP